MTVPLTVIQSGPVILITLSESLSRSRMKGAKSVFVVTPSSRLMVILSRIDSGVALISILLVLSRSRAAVQSDASILRPSIDTESRLTSKS